MGCEKQIQVKRELSEQPVPVVRENIVVGGGGIPNFDQLPGRPKYDGQQMTSATDIPSVENLSTRVDAAVESLGESIAAESTVRESMDSALQSQITTEITARESADSGLSSQIADEVSARQTADATLQGQIDAISASSDVTDIVGTYAELQSYDTSTLGDNNIIKVLQDESRNDETTYYRWSTTTQTFTLIGEEGPYYTKSAADTKFQGKLTPGTNIAIDANNEISATDTTYSDFTGTDGSAAGASGLVPAPATTDADKFLKADGTWAEAGGGGGALYPDTGTNTDGAMTQLATSNMIYPSGDEERQGNIFIKGGGQGSAYYLCIGPAQVSGFVNTANGSTAIGQFATATGNKSLAIAGGNQFSTASGTGSFAAGGGTAAANYAMALGYSSSAQLEGLAVGHNAFAANYATALGSNASATNNTYGVAIGYLARAYGSESIAIGSRISTSGRTGTVVIGNGPANNTQYATRNNEFCVHASTTANQPMVHSNVDTPTLGTDAANKDYVDGKIITGGTTAPDSTTVGQVGTLYAWVENGAGKLSICTDDTGGTYTWSSLV